MTSSAVATPHHLSARAGQEILARGGNAVDAAVAAVAVQGVVAPETCGVGGDLFALVHAPGWEMPLALNASGRAGSGVDADQIRSTGLDGIPREHRAAVTIPGCVDGMAALIDRSGRLTLADVLEPAIVIASSGFEVSAEQAGAFARQAEMYARNPAVSEFYPEGQPVTRGETVCRPNLARTLQAVGDRGRSAFYLGDPGADIIDELGGLITAEDLQRTQSTWVDPISVEVAGLTAWTIPPNSQGYLGPAALAVFEMLDPPDDPSDPQWWHLLIEAYRCVAWERNDVVADPDHVALPAHLLLDRDRLRRASSTVDPEHAGVWPALEWSPASTAYLCTADSDGMAVSIIQSNYSGTGSLFGARRSGFLLQDRGRGFTLTPGHPNEVGPGKRPLHTLSPTLWTVGDQPRWVIGTRGGSVQPQLVAQLAARAILGTAPLDEAQRAPRWTTSEFGPGSASHLVFEPGVPDRVLRALGGKGHHIELAPGPMPGWGPMSVIELDGDIRRTAPDPRVDTTAALVF